MTTNPLDTLVFQGIWETRKHPIEDNLERVIYDVHWQESEGMMPPDRALVLKIMAMFLEIYQKNPGEIDVLKGQAWLTTAISYCLKNGVNPTLQEVITEKYQEIIKETQTMKSH